MYNVNYLIVIEQSNNNKLWESSKRTGLFPQGRVLFVGDPPCTAFPVGTPDHGDFIFVYLGLPSILKNSCKQNIKRIILNKIVFNYINNKTQTKSKLQKQTR